MKNSIYFFSIILITILAGCSKDDHNHNDQEVINQLKINLSSASGNKKLVFEDPDGEGGIKPTITGDTLKANTIYTVTISLFSLINNSYKDISSEIESKGPEHQFFYSSTNPPLTFSYDDKDTKNSPIGLKSIWTTAAAGSGKVKVVLRHEPNKSAAGVSSGNILNAGGETDIEVEFDVVVQ